MSTPKPTIPPQGQPLEESKFRVWKSPANGVLHVQKNLHNGQQGLAGWSTIATYSTKEDAEERLFLESGQPLPVALPEDIQIIDNNRPVQANPPPAETIPLAIANAVTAVHFAGLELIQLAKMLSNRGDFHSQHDVYRMLTSLRAVESELMGLQGLPAEVAP